MESGILRTGQKSMCALVVESIHTGKREQQLQAEGELVCGRALERIHEASFNSPTYQKTLTLLMPSLHPPSPSRTPPRPPSLSHHSSVQVRVQSCAP